LGKGEKRYMRVDGFFEEERSGNIFGRWPREYPKDWFWEGNVVDALERALAESGWRIENKADTQSKQQGVDLLASKESRELFVEAKGYPSKEYRDPRVRRNKTYEACEPGATVVFSRSPKAFGFKQSIRMQKSPWLFRIFLAIGHSSMNPDWSSQVGHSRTFCGFCRQSVGMQCAGLKP